MSVPGSYPAERGPEWHLSQWCFIEELKGRRTLCVISLPPAYPGRKWTTGRLRRWGGGVAHKSECLVQLPVTLSEKRSCSRDYILGKGKAYKSWGGGVGNVRKKRFYEIF